MTVFKIGNRKYQLYNNKALFFLIIGAFIIRATYTFFAWQMQGGTATFVDDWDYINYAVSIVNEGLIPSNLDEPWFVVGPVYPLIIALVKLVFPSSFISVLIGLNVIMATAVVPLIYLIGKKLNNTTVGLIAAFIATLYPPLFLFTSRILKESLLIILVMLLIYSMIRWLKYQKPKYSIGIPVILFFTVLIHTDERYLTYFPLLVLTMLFWWKKDKFSGLKKSIFFTLGVVILMIPFTVRNYLAYERPVILTERVAIYTDKLLGYEDENTLINTRENRLEKFISFRDSLMNGYDPKPRSGRMKAIKEGIKEYDLYPYTFSFWGSAWSNFKEMWRPLRLEAEFVYNGWKFKKPRDRIENILYFLSYGLMLPFFLGGIYLVFKHNNKIGIFFFLLILWHTFFHVFIAHGMGRYRFPVDFMIILLAAYSIQYWLHKVKILK